MIRITVQVDGMMCGMCEAHINDAVRRALPVKKVASHRKRKETVILTEQDIPDSRSSDSCSFFLSATGAAVSSTGMTKG